MRKLLRKFHDIMVSGSIEDGEECPICMTEMKVGQVYSYTCEHTFCTECTDKLAPTHEEIVSCPTCRKRISKDDMDVIQFTASQQWDALLAVAERWAKIDRRRELETSDEEEENWLDDGDGTSDAK
ncbi:hypothetical protein PHLGIDRAFT_310361 [Phlebiopsis gigantea 11061_1 CR5-6]|uniref:RING-type domain-containing protein n=1 Tax=Phlebiopsis gigantea (strain 11061_1 CR5-6) TaxID=745531 RepID=A0A0C3PB24_PHLG1|nr:hypothetical protein PHLGIDRAFT_310361 [Phlebiopsis gigantea 11061_1 CR5-6]